VILIKTQETVRFIAKFDDFGGDPVPFMYHCHMLIHEDGGMMGQFVVAATTGIFENSVQDNLPYSIYPNPAQNLITFVSENDKQVSIDIEIFNLQGSLVIKKSLLMNKSYTMDVSSLKTGFYTAVLRSDNEKYSKKIIIK